MASTGQLPGETPHRCEVCGKPSYDEPSVPSGDTVCPHCGVLIWPSQSRKLRLLRDNEHGRFYLHELSSGRLIQAFVPHCRCDGKLASRLRKEVALLSRIDHASLVRIRGVNVQDSRAVIVSDYVEGDSLRTWLDRVGTISVGDATLIAMQCCAALTALHQHDCLHRSIDPEAIWIADDGCARLIPSHVLVRTKMLPAADDMSAIHMAQEQITGAQQVTMQTDVYGLASTFYELVTGRGPFKGASRMEALMQSAHDDPPLLTQLDESVPMSLSEVLLSALRKNPIERPDAATFATQLSKYAPARSTLLFCS